MLVTSNTNPTRGEGGGEDDGSGARRWLAAVRRLMSVIRARLGAQNGFTLIEVLLSASLSIVVLGAVLAALVMSQNTQSRESEWAATISEARTNLSTMTHELRQAYRIQIEATNHAKITFDTTIGTTEWAIEYNCKESQPSTEYKECVRRAVQFKEGKAPTAAELSSATAVPVVRDVLNGTKADEPESKEDPIFQEFSPNEIAPDLVTIRLVVPASGTLKLASADVYKHHVVLYEGAYIRDMATEA